MLEVQTEELAKINYCTASANDNCVITYLFKMKLCLHSIDNNMLMICSGSQDACFCINAIVMISFAGEVFYRCCYFASGDTTQHAVSRQ